MNLGITGHQNLIDTPTESWVISAITQLVSSMRIDSAFSCLAVGADQIFAQIILDKKLPLIAVLSCEKILATFVDASNKEEFTRLLGAANGVIQLPFEEPSEEAFFAGGKVVVDQSDVLLAVWNGKPARGIGGTGDVVEYALKKGVEVLHLNLIDRKVVNLTAKPSSTTNG